MRRTLLAGVAVLFVGLTACGTTLPGAQVPAQGITDAGAASFVGTDYTSVSLLSWTNDGQGHVSGTLQSAIANSAYVQSGSGLPLKNATVALAGTISNGAVSLHEELGPTFVGTIKGTTLTMQFPQQNGTVESYVFQPGSASDYNAQVQRLTSQLQDQRATIDSQQQAAQAEQRKSDAEQRKSEAAQALSGDLSKLGGDEAAVADAVSKLPAAKQEITDASTKADAAMVAAKKSSPCDTSGILAQAATANAAGVSAVQSLLSAVDRLATAVSALRSDLGRIQQDKQTLLGLSGQLPSGFDSAVAQANSALSKGQAELANAQNVVDTTTQQQQAYQTALDALGLRMCR
jgi:hypothetical protein